MYNSDVEKEGTCRRYFCSQLSDNTNTYSVEISQFGYNGGDGCIIPYSIEDCKYGGKMIVFIIKLMYGHRFDAWEKNNAYFMGIL